jgi:hypothetical protein
MTGCVVPKCKTGGRSRPGEQQPEKVVHFSFPNPTKNAAIHKKWVKIVQRLKKDRKWKPLSKNAICAKHFDNEQFLTRQENVRKTGEPCKKMRLHPGTTI